VLAGEVGPNPEHIFWEHEGNRAVRSGKWKLVSYYSEAHGYATQWSVGTGCRQGDWELYDIENDPAELSDLIETERPRAAEMMRQYDSYAERTGVVDWEEIQRKLGKCDGPDRA
jgi:arylsulfatase